MTEKLYYVDSHIKEFYACVTSVKRNEENNLYEVILDKTAFFPEGGGQTSDKGFIGTARVIDVQEIDGEIIHYTDTELCEKSEYFSKLDYEERFYKMQNHTGEHIISGIINRRFGFDNTGFHMGHDGVYVDYNGYLTAEELAEVEAEANIAVWENVKIITEFPDKNILPTLTYRSKLDLTENVRLVTIEGYDVCACCAPHVKLSGEVGIIKILESVKNKGGTRLRMLCGNDALADYNKRFSLMSRCANRLSIKQEDLDKAITKLEDEISSLKDKIYHMREELIEHRIENIGATEGNLCFFEDGLANNDMRKIMNRALPLCGGICAVFNGNDDIGYTYVAASKRVNLRETLEEMKIKLMARGGGAPELIQGSVAAKRADIEAFFEA